MAASCVGVRSVEMMREKAEKRKLERRIAMLQSNARNFDNIKKLEEIPEFRNVQQKIHHQYVVFERSEILLIISSNTRDNYEYHFRVSRNITKYKRASRLNTGTQILAELEKERDVSRNEKAQVERYKKSLKQRDIMIALTQRLNERDEQIVELQEELDAYNQQH